MLIHLISMSGNGFEGDWSIGQLDSGHYIVNFVGDEFQRQPVFVGPFRTRPDAEVYWKGTGKFAGERLITLGALVTEESATA